VTRPGFFGGATVLELDGAVVAVVRSAAGGEPFGEVVREPVPGRPVDKRIGGVRATPLTVEVGLHLAAPLVDRVAAALDGTQAPARGRLLRLDGDRLEQSCLQWRSALVTEIALPELDVTRREPAAVAVTLAPDATRQTVGSGERFELDPPPASAKAALTSNFRFEVSGLEAAARHVLTVSRLTVAFEPAPDGGGAQLPDVRDVSIRVPEAEVGPYLAWFEEFVLDGSGTERTASLTFLRPDLTTPVLRVLLSGLGIFRVAREELRSGSEVEALARVEMYCETARIER
jgi:hypothetical protein